MDEPTRIAAPTDAEPGTYRVGDFLTRYARDMPEKDLRALLVAWGVPDNLVDEAAQDWREESKFRASVRPADSAPALDVPPGPVQGALRRMQQEPDGSRDRRFLELLWDERPQLVAAVALWRETKDLHPELYRRSILEPKREAARELHRAALREGHLPDPEAEALRVMREIVPSRERMEYHGRRLLQLLRLGWGRWWPKDETDELPRTAGGGEPMPQWTLDVEPSEVDGAIPETDASGWWYIEEPDAPRDPLDPLGGRPGFTLRNEAVRAVWVALGCKNPNDRRARKAIAQYVPSAWPELHDARRRGDDGRDTPLLNTLRNVARKAK